MPAPNIAYLYDIETAYEDCLRNHFANLNIGGQTFTQAITPRSNLAEAEFLKTPRLMVRCGISGVGSAGAGLKEDSYTFANVSQNYWSYYQLTAELTVCTQRNNVSQSQGLLRGGVRRDMLAATAIMNNTSLPYYQTAEVVPLTSTQGIDAENDEISTQLMYQLDVFIPPASFPSS